MNSLGMMRCFTWLSQLFYLLLLLHSQLTSSSSSFSSSAMLCSQEQSSALLQFKQLFSFSKYASFGCDEVGHQSYPKMESWKKGTDCCSWDGVTCDRLRGDVIGLDLSCSWLYGTIPSNSSLFLLPHLQWLNLASNNFNYSSISSSFGQFARLKHLDLSHSSFSGEVPLEISHLSQLASLDLSTYYPNVSLETSTVKRLVQNLTILRELRLDVVDMSSVSLSSLMNLSSTLTSLTLRDCLLRGMLPDQIFHLPNLRELILTENPKLTWFFPMVNWSKPLRYLDISRTICPREFPKSIANLKFLQRLFLSECQFNGSIPTWLGNLTQLTKLDLSANDFVGEMPSSFSNLNTLISLDLRSNHLNGALPIWLGNVTRVIEVLLGNNSFTGQIPSSLSNLKDLAFLGLRSNNFGGRIPDCLTNLTKLTSVFLSNNKLTSQFGEFQFSNSLEYLSLDNNNLYGSIPKSISKLMNLTYLDFSSNDLTGIGDFDMFKNLKKLRCVDFSGNLLHGKLPILPSSISIFLIANNRLSGEIPSMICNLTFFKILDISNNSLSGTILPCLGNLTNFLYVMDVGMNSFHGTIPKIFAKGNRLRTLSFGGNELEGILPKSLVNCINLEVLDLGNNKINDSFPNWLEALPNLQVLVLSSNKFHGPIENYMTSGMFFSKLRILDLSHNEFTGLLPTKFFEELEAIKSTNESEHIPKYMGKSFLQSLPRGHGKFNYLSWMYQDSVEVDLKGHELVLWKISTVFTIIDLSSNKFYGKIPEALGMLKFLRLLNLSHNRLTGHIPSSFTNLLALESLDLSSNMLIGEIPVQLTSLTFLAVLNLSQNQLSGPIPQGKQFGTFQNDSYDGNPGLCGFPLSMKCSTDDPLPPPQPSVFQEDNDSMFVSGFGWKAVLIGYGCGLLFGLVVGCVVFKTGKPQWLVRLIEGEQNGMVRRPINPSSKRRRE